MWIINGGANFLPFAVVPLTLLVGLVALLGSWRLTLLAAFPLLAWSVLMLRAGDFASAANCEQAPELRAMTANVLMSNQDLEALATDVLNASPDLVVFQELRRPIEEALPVLADRYPYRASTEEPWVTLASRIPLDDVRRVDVPFADKGRQPVAATVHVAGQPVTVLAVHVMPPLNSAANALHVAQYRLLAHEVARTAAGPLLVIGDFNATPLSPTFAGFLRGSGLRLASLADTPTHVPYARLGLRIDHILQRGFDVCGEQVVELTGSDHRGVAVDLRLAGPVRRDSASR